MKTMTEIFNDITALRKRLEAIPFGVLTEQQKQDYLLAILIDRKWADAQLEIRMRRTRARAA